MFSVYRVYIFLVKRVPGWGPEQRETEKTVLYLQNIIIFISYVIIKLLIMENHPSWNWKWNCTKIVFFLVKNGIVRYREGTKEQLDPILNSDFLLSCSFGIVSLSSGIALYHLGMGLAKNDEKTRCAQVDCIFVRCFQMLSNHRHLNYLDWLIVYTTYIADNVSFVSGCCKKTLWKASANHEHSAKQAGSQGRLADM